MIIACQNLKRRRSEKFENIINTKKNKKNDDQRYHNNNFIKSGKKFGLWKENKVVGFVVFSKTSPCFKHMRGALTLRGNH